ncbi:hypothetical protein F4818DRAFT_454647 [Hypoxylon cercidicola]|nr:hypothetical protein F4818DRAFT_454647 [Hypoxylon cercidicola]
MVPSSVSTPASVVGSSSELDNTLDCAEVPEERTPPLYIPKSTPLVTMESEIALRWYHNSLTLKSGLADTIPPPSDSDHQHRCYSSDSPTRIDSDSATIVSSTAPKTKPTTIGAVFRALLTFNWWWWSEITAVVIAVTSLAGLLGVLARYNGLALTDRTFYLQPNSVVAALTTIIKLEIILSVSMCFSELKWQHFSTPRRLDELQVLDDASRGEWGSLNLMFRMRSWTLLTFGLSMTALAALLIEPAAQQLLAFPSREVELKEVNAEIGIANNFDSNSYQELNNITYGRKLGLGSNIIKSATGDTLPFYFNCSDPAVRCTYPAFTTLGICFSFRNTTDVSRQTCVYDDTTGATKCQISWPTVWDFIPENDPLNMTSNYTSNDGSRVSDVFQFTHLRSHDNWVYMSGGRLPLEDVREKPQSRVEVFECLWYWCVQTFDASVGSAKDLSPRITDSEPLILVEPFVSPSGESIYRTNSTDNVYRLGPYALAFLWNGIYGALYSSLAAIIDISDTWNTSEGTSDPSASGYGIAYPPDDISYFLYYSADLQVVFHNVATALSNIIRIPNTGENLNSTVIRGQAIGTETYIGVRWQWILLPVIETVSAAVLLAATIIVTMRSRRPLLKSSVNSLLLHGI